MPNRVACLCGSTMLHKHRAPSTSDAHYILTCQACSTHLACGSKRTMLSPLQKDGTSVKWYTLFQPRPNLQEIVKYGSQLKCREP